MASQPKSNFVSAKVDLGPADATQYAFFGDAGPISELLDGSLEDGLEGPPEEERIDGDWDDSLLVDEEDNEDLSLASVLRQPAPRSPPGREDAQHSAPPVWADLVNNEHRGSLDVPREPAGASKVPPLFFQQERLPQGSYPSTSLGPFLFPQDQPPFRPEHLGGHYGAPPCVGESPISHLPGPPVAPPSPYNLLMHQQPGLHPSPLLPSVLATSPAAPVPGEPSFHSLGVASHPRRVVGTVNAEDLEMQMLRSASLQGTPPNGSPVVSSSRWPHGSPLAPPPPPSYGSPYLPQGTFLPRPPHHEMPGPPGPPPMAMHPGRPLYPGGIVPPPPYQSPPPPLGPPRLPYNEQYRPHVGEPPRPSPPGPPVYPQAAMPYPQPMPPGTSPRPHHLQGSPNVRAGGPGAGIHERSRRRYPARMMTDQEIEKILHIQYAATHQAHPYFEDFYYLAYLNKMTGGVAVEKFAPEKLREITLDRGADALAVKFSDMVGLGRFVLSNIRSPKVLIDVAHDLPKDTAEGEEEVEKVGGRRLEQEPLLAARMMIEDCLSLLLDVEDVDRIFTLKKGQVEDAQALRQRRMLLIEGIAASFQLPDGAASGGIDPVNSGSDRVFHRIISLVKGRKLLAKTLKLLFPPAAFFVTAAADDRQTAVSSPHLLKVLYALMRHALELFGPPIATHDDADKSMEEATMKLAMGAVEVIRKLESRESVCACLEAFNISSTSSGHKGGLLPLYPAGRVPPESNPHWLGTLLAAVCLRAAELGLDNTVPDTQDVVRQHWQTQFHVFHSSLMAHLQILCEMKRGYATSREAVQVVHSLTCVTLMRTTMAISDPSQKEGLRQHLIELTGG